MLIKPDCIPCILKMVISATRKLPLHEETVKDLCGRYLEIPALKGLLWEITSAEVVELVLKELIDATKNLDPFHPEKLQQNKRIVGMYSFLKELVSTSSDPLRAAVRLAITGNAIDPMGSGGIEGTEDSIRESLEMPIPRQRYSAFKARLKKAKLLLYFCDNAGEIVFDKLLVETIRKHHDVEVVFVVRSLPALNDATLEEARLVGMHDVGRVVGNGINGPLPGTVLRRCSSELNDLVAKADFIISKGGGNSETLDEENHLNKNIAFMLLSKCHPHYIHFGVEIGRPILVT